MPHGIDRLPRNQHRHDGGLARACRQLQSEAQQLRIGLLVAALDVRPELRNPWPELRRDLCEPDRRLDGFDLAEERTDAFELMMPPML